MFLPLQHLSLPLIRSFLRKSCFLPLSFIFDSGDLRQPLVALLGLPFRPLLALHFLLQLSHGLLAALFFPEEADFGDFQLTTLSKVLG